MSHALDDALGELHAYGCELNNGLTNHAPMVAEALHHMGLDSAISQWVRSELSRCLLRPRHVAAISPDNWVEALGDASRFSDWSAFFLSEIENLGWPATAQLWVMRLAPGFASSAAHGAIRCGHALRGLTDTDTTIRQWELADALASWACEYAELPARQNQPANQTPSQALASTPLVAAEHHHPHGSITRAVQQLSTYPAFAEHFGRLDTNDDLTQLGLDMAATFARLFVQSATSPLGAIVFTHAITGVAAAGHMAPFLAPDQYRIVLRHCFHTGAALHAVYSSAPYTPPTHEPLPLEAEECVYDALEHGDEHVIKLTEACVAFDRATADAFFLTAAEQARRLLPERNSP